MEFISEAWRTLTTPPFVHLLVFSLCLFTLGILGRLLGGFKPARTPARTASVCFTLIFLYVVSIILFGEDAHLQIFAGALPFLNTAGDAISISMMMKTDFLNFLIEVTQVFFLALTVALVRVPVDLVSKATGSKTGFLVKLFTSPLLFYPWYLVECVILFIGMGANVGIDWLLTNYISATFAKWLPVVFFAVLAIIMLLMLLKLIFSTVAFFAKPFFTVLWNFFTENFLGKTIKTAFLTTFVVVLAVLILDALGAFEALMSIVLPSTVFAPIVLLIIGIAYITWIFCF